MPLSLPVCLLSLLFALSFSSRFVQQQLPRELDGWIAAAGAALLLPLSLFPPLALLPHFPFLGHFHRRRRRRQRRSSLSPSSTTDAQTEIFSPSFLLSLANNGQIMTPCDDDDGVERNQQWGDSRREKGSKERWMAAARQTGSARPSSQFAALYLVFCALLLSLYTNGGANTDPYILFDYSITDVKNAEMTENRLSLRPHKASKEMRRN